MPYKTDYTIMDNGDKKMSFLLRAICTVSFFFIFVILVTFFWPEGKEVLGIILFPDRQINAMEVLACELESGNTFKSAVNDFVQTIVRYENIR